MHFAKKYHQLATSLAEISFKEEGDHAAWTIVPIPHPWIDAGAARFHGPFEGLTRSPKPNSAGRKLLTPGMPGSQLVRQAKFGGLFCFRYGRT